MSHHLSHLIKKSKYDNKALLNIIQQFTPKIDNSLRQTKYQNREDLSQELKLKLIIYIRNYDVGDLPGFFETLEKIDNSN